jgi:hypothetical protein
MANKIDSNITGLRYAEEVLGTLGVLPGSPVWYPLEPNSYGEFGPQISTTARAPITPSRQRKKGVVTDLDATAGFQNDFVQESLYDMMQGFMYADWREKPNAEPSAVTGTAYTVTTPLGSSFASGDLVWAEGFTTPANNGLKVATGSTATTVVVSGLTAEASPPAGAKITKVGAQASSGDVEVDVTGTVVSLTSTTLDFTDLGLIPGEWLFIGGDATATQFDTAANNGFARVLSVAANALVLDRQPGTMVTDAGAAKTIQLFVGHAIKNESDPALIKQRSYQMERSLGSAGFEYIKGCVANTMEIKVSTADKVMVDLGFIGIDAEYRTVADGAKTGSRPDVPDQEAFNSSSDFSRLRMLNEDTAATLFTYLTELTVTINNNVTPSKAIGTLGAFDVTAGDFVAAGSVTAYFTSVEAIQAVRDNDDISLDFAMVKENAGWVFDIPFISIGDGRPQVEKDTEIKLPITMEGAEHPTLHHSMMAVSFTYLPTAAE